MSMPRHSNFNIYFIIIKIVLLKENKKNCLCSIFVYTNLILDFNKHYWTLVDECNLINIYRKNLIIKYIKR